MNLIAHRLKSGCVNFVKNPCSHTHICVCTRVFVYMISSPKRFSRSTVPVRASSSMSWLREATPPPPPLPPCTLRRWYIYYSFSACRSIQTCILCVIHDFVGITLSSLSKNSLDGFSKPSLSLSSPTLYQNNFFTSFVLLHLILQKKCLVMIYNRVSVTYYDKTQRPVTVFRNVTDVTILRYFFKPTSSCLYQFFKRSSIMSWVPISRSLITEAVAMLSIALAIMFLLKFLIV